MAGSLPGWTLAKMMKTPTMSLSWIIFLPVQRLSVKKHCQGREWHALEQHRNRRGGYQSQLLISMTKGSTPFIISIFQWVDNNVVLMVLTVHLGEEVVEKIRRRPRENKINKQALPKVFGNNQTAIVGIPEVIDYYNYKMKWVDMGDQLISNYWPLLRNRRYWMALFMHGLDIARINSFLVCKSQAKIHKRKQQNWKKPEVFHDWVG